MTTMKYTTFEALERQLETQAAQIGVLLKALNAVNDEDEDFWILVETALTITPNEALQAFAAKVREQCAILAETPVYGEQDDITMEAKDRVAKAIRNLKELPK